MDMEEALDQLFGVDRARQAAFQHFVSMGIPPDVVVELMTEEERRILGQTSKKKTEQKKKRNV
ncbi:MAG: hypothetical protein ACPL7J_14700 [Desulfomonilaceae bacterium]